MISAFTTSCLFPISLSRLPRTSDQALPRHGPIRVVYFTILISHVLLATIVPLALVTLGVDCG